MRERKTSRVLNDQSYFLGLSYNDISSAGVLLLILVFTFKALGIQNMIWTLILTIFIVSLMVPIRLSYRRKIIRDSLMYLLKKGVIHVPKNYRIK